MHTQTILKWSLVLSIVIVLNLFFNFAIETAYNRPVYEDFCGTRTEQVVKNPQTETQCVAEGGQWTEDNITSRELMPVDGSTEIKQTISGWCDPDFTCRQELDTAREFYNRNVFIVLVFLGLISLGLGVFLSSIGSAVSLGLSLGGTLSFVIASMRYWADMDDYLRVVVLGLALIALIAVGVKKFKE
jgi:hypothetical protein